jgi:hypothetical protein
MIDLVAARDFFISYTLADRAWAEWIAWELEDAGYTTLIQAWDFRPGMNFVTEMQKGAAESSRTLIVLSRQFLESGFTQAEWTAAFAKDPTGEKGVLILVRVAECELPALLQARVYIDFVGLGEEDALRRKLLDGVKQGRAKPATRPPNPATQKPALPIVGRRTIHNLPFQPNPLFTGREAELEALSRGLEQGETMAAMQMVAVHGLGGVGKTQLAVEYAWKHLGDYDAVFWVEADSAVALDVSLAALTSKLRLAEALGREEAVQRQAVLDWLSNNRRWLLIADNADNAAATSAVLERLSPCLTGHVLITSRISDWPLNIREVRLDTLSPDEATRYLLDRVARRGHDAGAQAAAGLLAHELGNLPIALEQAASFIVEVRWSFDKYRQQLRESRPELLSVAKTWSITLNQLTPLARALLRIAAWWFALDAIPRSVFAADREVLSEALDARATVSDLAIDKALGELNRFSLIRLGNETFSVHRLLQAAEQDSLTGDEKQRWREWAIRLSIKFNTSEAERKHLLNLGRGRTSNYQGRHSLRSELRHLRWMGLLAMKPGRVIGDIRDNLTGDLSDYVYLTPNGKEWVEVLARMTTGGGSAAGGGGC